MMQLCVGAVSIRVIEEAAALGVAQVVASRRQVDVNGGYTGLDQVELVSLVRSYGQRTQVVRDHGGPLQGPDDDDGITSFDADVAAGFDVLHLDVSKLSPGHDQLGMLEQLMLRYGDQVPVETGGEHDDEMLNHALFNKACDVGTVPVTAVVNAGGYTWADRQHGSLLEPSKVTAISRSYQERGARTKLHNMDYVGGRWRYYLSADYFNVAPELAGVEIEALLRVLPIDASDRLLQLAYDSGHWKRWFAAPELVPDVAMEGTWDERAKCAIRYVLEWPEIRELAQLNPEQEVYVRGRIRAALVAG